MASLRRRTGRSSTACRAHRRRARRDWRRSKGFGPAVTIGDGERASGERGGRRRSRPDALASSRETLVSSDLRPWTSVRGRSRDARDSSRRLIVPLSFGSWGWLDDERRSRARDQVARRGGNTVLHPARTTSSSPESVADSNQSTVMARVMPRADGNGHQEACLRVDATGSVGRANVIARRSREWQHFQQVASFEIACSRRVAGR